MKRTAYGQPLFLSGNNEEVALEKVLDIDERSVQDLIFRHPACLPISEIDESYNTLVPVCTELRMAAGRLDILLVTPTGELAIVETKLWRNPEARRKVIAQILDYAKELAKWTYADLQREVNRRLGTKGNALYALVADEDAVEGLPEADFVDAVSRNLARGKFLLLIAGDGIREGAHGIAEFLTDAGYLQFTFAMVELDIYQAAGIGRLVVPKTIVKTVELSKWVVEIPKGLILTRDDRESAAVATETPSSPEREREKQFYTRFWRELVDELTFDDPEQPLPNPGQGANLFVYPEPSKKAWISAYFMNSRNRVGVYFRTANDQAGQEIFDHLDQYREEIYEELGEDIIWTWEESAGVGVRMPCDNVFAPENREDIKEFFKDWLNTLVNVFRPRLKRR